MANPHNPVHHYARIPGVLGAARCHEDSEACETTGAEADPLGNILMYLRQSASLLGEAFGLEELSEVHVQAKGVAALCLPRGAETIGLLLPATTRPADVVTKVATLRGEF